MSVLLGAPLFVPVLAPIDHGKKQALLLQHPYDMLPLKAYLYGRGRITGTVSEKALPTNTPLRRLVRLHRETDGAFVQATWSDATTGNYTFNGVRQDCKYFVTSFDYTGTYRAVIADNLTPDPL